METVKSLFERLTALLRPLTQAVASALPSQPSEETITTARASVEAASASIVNADGERGTAVSLVHEGNAYIIASAHVTNNRLKPSTGFDYHGRKLFLMVRGTRVAFAEHIAVNPQGGVCDINGNIDINKPFSEVSILKLLDPEETRSALQALSSDNHKRKHLGLVLLRYPELGIQSLGANPSPETLMQLTRGFALPPAPISKTPPIIGYATAFSVGYFDNKPHPVTHVASDIAHINGTIKTMPGTVKTFFQCEQAVLGGHSGSLLFSVAADGGINPLGIINVTDVPTLTAYGTKFQEVINGMNALTADKLIKVPTNLDHICAALPGISAWYNPAAITAGSLAKPAGTGQRNRVPDPTCAQR